MFHPFPPGSLRYSLPALFTYPFNYTPHPLCRLAAQQVCRLLDADETLSHSLRAEGKMFGVLVVSSPQGETGFLAAFSGLLNGRSLHPFFVPPVYDLQRPDGFFKEEEARISALNAAIARLEADATYTATRRQLDALIREAAARTEASRALLRAHRDRRRLLRLQTTDPARLEALDAESRFEKAEHRRLEQHYKAETERLGRTLADTAGQIEQLKAERRQRSNALQQRLFAAFSFLNARGEECNLNELFRHTVQRIPPSGAGECAAPRLLQYAYAHGYVPRAMAEFWWGAEATGSVRRQGCYYPACSGKCAPILAHMLQGLAVEPDPAAGHPPADRLETVFEDQWLAVVNKPSGLLTIPGKEQPVSVYSLLRARYPQATGPLVVHRLDMDTSGLLLIAKDKATHRALQAQFESHTVKKRYTALLEGRPDRPAQGTIRLPLRPDPMDRPRQMVDHVRGKFAETRYNIIGIAGTRTRVDFRPVTGRTHQLRVHAAHPEGLGVPIAGDALYGEKADRLYLHAAEIAFIHPVTQQPLCIRREADFDKNDEQRAD